MIMGNISIILYHKMKHKAGDKTVEQDFCEEFKNTCKNTSESDQFNRGLCELFCSCYFSSVNFVL